MIKVEENISLSRYSTLQVGGLARYFVEVTSLAELQEALEFSKKTPAPLAVLGGGSNVLITDAGFDGLVIKNSLTGISDLVHGDHAYLHVGAGETLDDLVQYAVDKNFWGLENLSAIPGTVGATPIQNVGAYGVEVSSLITEVSAINKITHEEKNFSNKDCGFGYRDSYFKTKEGKDWIVTEVVFKLSLLKKPRLEYGTLQDLKFIPSLTPAKIRAEVTKIRATKFPDWTKVGTAGSFFKNPIISTTDFNLLKERYPDLVGYELPADQTKVPLGWVLDNICNLKGHCENGVCLYEHQALVLINQSADKEQTIDNFAKTIENIVKEKTGIEIEREVSSL